MNLREEHFQRRNAFRVQAATRPLRNIHHNLGLHIFFTDLFKLYNSANLNPDQDNFTLQAKVQFDIRFYFARQGAENIMEMQVDTLKLSDSKMEKTPTNM